MEEDPLKKCSFAKKWLSTRPNCPILFSTRGVPRAYQVSNIDRKEEWSLVFQKILITLDPQKQGAHGGTLVMLFHQKDRTFELEKKLSKFYSFQHFATRSLSYLIYSVHVFVEKVEKGKGHANSCVVNLDLNEMEIFDPHGTNAFLPQQSLLETLQPLLRVPSHYRLITSNNQCSRDKEKEWQWQFSLPLCFYYNVLFWILRLKCPVLTREQILQYVSALNGRDRVRLLEHVHCLIEDEVEKVNYEATAGIDTRNSRGSF